MAELLYRLVASFQYRENYGAHGWNGIGECPQYWKYKGGEEVNVLVGVKEPNDKYIVLVKESMAEELAKYSWSDYYSQQYLVGFHWEPTIAYTEKEEIEAYCDWHEDLFGEADEEPYQDTWYDKAAMYDEDYA